ncbi:hypothetical protein CRM22_009287, partial [Opisthorchis felineus]
MRFKIESHNREHSMLVDTTSQTDTDDVCQPFSHYPIAGKRFGSPSVDARCN